MLNGVLLTVRIRRDFPQDVRPSAEQVDGKTFEFTDAWIIEEGIYRGEWAFVAMDENYPQTAPAWIATGDLTATEGERQRWLGQEGEDLKNWGIAIE